jgi:hypothetical protein
VQVLGRESRVPGVKGHFRPAEPAGEEAALVVSGRGLGPERQEVLKGPIVPEMGKSAVRPDEVDLDSRRRPALKVDESPADEPLPFEGNRDLLADRSAVQGFESKAIAGGSRDEANPSGREGGGGSRARQLKSSLGVGLAQHPNPRGHG